MNGMSGSFDASFLMRIRQKTAQPAIRDRLQQLLLQMSAADLQDRTKVRQFVNALAVTLNETLSPNQREQLVSWIIEQRINPRNPLHWLRLVTLF